ncbi:MAG: DNA cytosine methyltransferase [Azospirillaceae bacterium]|nr:DNA cytosine methyltransferase [Azospirillaceae bacterium]
MIETDTMRLRTLDLFCGGGGSSLGAQVAGAEIVCGIDAWDIASQTYKANFPNAAAPNVTLGEKSSPVDLGLDLGDINLILASPECTNHTCAKGNAPRNENSKRTARYLLNFARVLSPRWMVLENVVHMRKWDGYDPLVAELGALGYYVRRQVLDAGSFGVPQTRRRLFLLCDRERMPDEVPLPFGSVTKTARDILDPPGTWSSRPLYRDGRAVNTIARAERAMQDLGRGKDFLIVYYGSDGSGGWQALDKPIRTLTTLDRFGLVTWNADTPMLRMLQVPELKRAMGFCGKLDHGCRRDRIMLLGNGVCPPVMTAIVRSLTAPAVMAAAAE